MTILHLYELTDQFKQLNDLAETGDLPPQVILDTLEGLTGEWKDKAINVAKFILNCEAAAESKIAAAKQMAASAKRLADRAESLRNYLLLNFQGTNQTKVESEWFDIVVKNNPPSVGVDDVNKVPDQYITPPDEPPVLDLDQTIEFVHAEDGVPRTWAIKDKEGAKVKSGVFDFKPATVDKNAVKKAHKAGIEIAGCHPEQGQRIDIVV
jgi:hypothetical protein